MPAGFMRPIPRYNRTSVFFKKALNSKEKKQVSSIAKRVVNKTIEKKWYLSSYAAHNVTNGGSLLALCAPSSGTAYNQRTGQRVKPTYISVRFAVEQNNAATQRQSCRFIIVQSRRGESAPGVADFPSFLGNFTPDQLSKYNVLMDKVVTLNENGAAAPVRKQFSKKIYAKKLHGMKWNAGTLSGTANDGGAITLYSCSDVGASPPTVTSDHIAYYTDA